MGVKNPRFRNTAVVQCAVFLLIVGGLFALQVKKIDLSDPRVCPLASLSLSVCLLQGEFKVSERYVTMSDLIAALKENRVKEMFGAGTACVVCPISTILYLGEVR